MHEVVAAIASCGVSPVVHIAANEAWMVKSMSPPTSSHSCSLSSFSYHHHHHSTNTILGFLDAGAHGICVPLLYVANDARRLVSQPSSHPGARGFASPFPTGTFNNGSLSGTYSRRTTR